MCENYSKIIDCLRSKFARKELHIKIYVREFLKLVLNKVTPSGKIDLYFIQQIEIQLWTIGTFEITFDKFSAMFFNELNHG